MRGYELRQVEGGEEIQLEQGARFLEGRPGGTEVGTTAGIVDEAIDSAKSGPGGGDEVGTEGLIGEVPGEHQIAGRGVFAESGFISGDEH